MTMTKKAALIIMDGWGKGQTPSSDAILQASTPFVDSLYKNYANAELVTFGTDVGLPSGQMGNSEVGHLNIGAGRTVFQDFLKINNAIESGEYFSNSAIEKIRDYCVSNDKPLHLLGLASDGGVHSHIDHIIETALFFDQQGIQVVLHLFTDGRDTDPQGGKEYIKKIQAATVFSNVEIATICGRYYAMDRDKRWERIKKAFDLLVNGVGEASDDLVATMAERYKNKEFDEFILPIVNNNMDESLRKIINGDAVFFVNFRTDRPRQLTEVLTQEDHTEQGMKTLDLFYSTMTEYNESFENINIIYPKDNLKGTLGEIIANKGLTQLRVAETEKYPHVTFFFNGGREIPFDGEDRIMVNSPKVATYDLQPEMSANEVCSKTIEHVKLKKPDFLCLNFANADMVGHTGDFQAAMKACEAVDQYVKKLVDCLLEENYSCIIIADHGNADYMINEDGSPNTAHSMNPVPVFLVSNTVKPESIRTGDLTDVAPTLLSLMEIERGEEMTGKVLYSL